MKNLIVFACLLTVATSCSSSSGSNEEQAEIRINLVLHGLALTHNSHLNKSFSTEDNSYSAIASLEVYLSENTDYKNIQKVRITDDGQTKWVFSLSEIEAVYNPQSNSLRFENLDLRTFAALTNRFFFAEILDENDEIIADQVFSLSNDFPLPASTSYEQLNTSTFRVNFDFYNTPYNGGNLPFSITIYNTPFASNAFSIIWLDESKSIIGEQNLNLNSITEAVRPNPDDLYYYDLNVDDIPDGSLYFYTKFVRGGQAFGRILNTPINEFSLDAGQ